MATWNSERQAAQAFKPYDRVGQPRAGPLPGETRDRNVYSIRTRAVYLECLKRQADWAKKQRPRCTLDRLTPEQARQYLEERRLEVGPKRLSHERCALALLPQIQPHENSLREIKPSRRLNKEGRLATVSRRRSPDEQQRIMDRQTARHAFSTEVALAGGLRASELLTLRARDEREPSPGRPWNPDRFTDYRDPVFFTVQGKGGLIREVAFERELAERIEATRHPDGETHVVRDRGVPRVTHYDLAGGNTWSASFTKASTAALGQSLGAHSVRHSFAQERRELLTEAGYSDGQTRLLISQQLGHFRPEITTRYFR